MLSIYNISDNIKTLLKDNNIKTDKFAESIGVSAQAVYQWKSRKKYPAIDTCVEICNVYGLTFEDLLGERK